MELGELHDIHTELIRVDFTMNFIRSVSMSRLFRRKPKQTGSDGSELIEPCFKLCKPCHLT